MHTLLADVLLSGRHHNQQHLQNSLFQLVIMVLPSF